MVTGEEQVWRGPPAHHGSHLGKPVPDHLETARPPITVARTCYPDPFLVLGSTHALVSTQENNHTPLSKCNHPPLLPQRCPSTLVVCPSPPLVADCALRLAAAAARCQDLFRERAGAGGQVRCGRTYWSIGRTPPLISPIPTLPNLAYLLSDCHFYQHLTRPSHQEISVFSQLHWKFQLQASVQALGMRMGERMFGNN